MSELVPLGICSFVKFWLDEYSFPRVSVFTKHNDQLICCGEQPPIYDIPVKWVCGQKNGMYGVVAYFEEAQGGLRTREGTLRECLVEWGPASCCMTVN